ncbi:MAG TPA: hypothetical protein VL595_34510 [Pseudonocardia sp.]|nr:hypothetical protein [Pseudonocardia sp.]
MTAPGPAPDRAAAELAEAWYIVMRHMASTTETHDARSVAFGTVLDEVDRQRVIVRAAEALVECVNEGHDLDDNSDHPLWNRLDALAAAVRAEGEGQ